MKTKRKICVFIGSRANYGSAKSALNFINKHPGLELILIAAASSLLDKEGKIVNLIREDGFKVNDELFMLLAGETPLTMSKSTGLGIIEASNLLAKHQPDFSFVIGDRFEVMSFVIASAYMNIPIAHSMGGEVTGTIDESIRHAITKFSHIHFVASNDAKNRVLKLGELKENVFNVGCPRIDLAKNALAGGINRKQLSDLVNQTGVGFQIDIEKEFLVVSQHPVTTEHRDAKSHIDETLAAVSKLGTQAIWLWPNVDAGSSDISKSIRSWREKNTHAKIRYVKSFEAETYMKLLDCTSCLVGNSSSGIREAAFIGTPVVNVGTRQNARERASNVLDVANNSAAIIEAVKKQMQSGKYKSDNLYGNGKAGEKIAEILAEIRYPNIQKTIAY